MAEKSSFFNSISGDRRYMAEDWADYFAAFVSSGVLLKPSGALNVTANAGSMGVKLAAGAALINGYRYANSAALTLSIDTAHASLGRIDAVMIRWSRATRSIFACIVPGTPAASPIAPAPTRSADVYDLCVSTVLVGAGVTSITQSRITDKRLDSTVCGIATMIGDLDTSTLYAQIQAALDDIEAGAMTDFTTWFDTAKNTLGGDSAGNLLNLINQINETKLLQTYTAASQLGVTISNTTTLEQLAAAVPNGAVLMISPP
ncbi:MAG TPA: hypothetical protein PKJ47_13870, partial [Candidatus Limiplasma sp.]|nr:hypothetical protein [Candidatus Limiplasma sp.]